MISLKTSKRIAATFFIIGTFLAVIQFILRTATPLVFFGLVFIIIAFVVNLVIFLLLLIDLIKRDQLETFYAMCIILANLPIAAVYAYILIEHT